MSLINYQLGRKLKYYFANKPSTRSKKSGSNIISLLAVCFLWNSNSAKTDSGQNVRLAAMLTGWKINIISKVKLQERVKLAVDGEDEEKAFDELESFLIKEEADII